MRKSLLTLGLVMAMATPGLAFAQTNACESAKHDKKVEGTVVGGVLGAVAGGLLAPKHDKLLGAAAGGAVGAVAGNQLSRDKTPCPDGSRRRVYDDRYYDAHKGRYIKPKYEKRCHWEERSYKDDRGRMVSEDWQVCK